MPSLKSFFTSALVATATVSASGLASAEALVFFGSDPLAGGTVPAGGQAQTARGLFSAALLSSSTENFEAATAGFQPTSASPQAVFGNTGTMFRNDGALGTTRIENRTSIGGSNTGRFNTTTAGAGKWWETSASFTLTLGSTVQAIGFYGTDFGDFAGSLTLHLFNGDAAVATDIDVPPGGGQNGSLLFYGYINNALSFNRVVFTVGQATPGNINSYDFVGIDDLVVGRANGTPPPGVPTPGTLALAMLSLGLLGYTRRRRG
jgi:hypothetical protein